MADLEVQRQRSRDCMRRLRARRKAAAEPAETSAPAPVKDPVGELVKWARECLKVPTGPLSGEGFRIADWQEDWLRSALAPGVREAGLSVARKNGKSGLIAALLLAHLVGPLRREQWRGVVVSLTGKLAVELRDAVQLTAAASGIALDLKRTPYPGVIYGKHGSRCDILAADRATGHAIGCDLAVIDEAGLLQENQRSLWDAVYSSTSGRDGRLLAISIRGDGPMFTSMHKRAADPAVHWREYAATPGCRLDDETEWLRANPGLGGIKSTSYMRDAARRALADPGAAGSFAAHDLNLPTQPSREMICQLPDWLACTVPVDELPAREGGCTVGIDLGGSASMTAAAVYWPKSRRLEVFGGFPAAPSLRDRGDADSVGDLYQRMADRGELQTYDGRVTPCALFVQDVAARLAGENVLACGFDRYRRAEVFQAFESAGVRWRAVPRGMGSASRADGSADVRSFQRLVLSRGIKCAPSLLLESAISESSIRRDAGGNPALDQVRSKGRIDALSSAVIACGLGELVAGNSDSGEAVYAIARAS